MDKMDSPCQRFGIIVPLIIFGIKASIKCSVQPLVLISQSLFFKSVFQLSVANQSGKINERNRLTRGQFERYSFKPSQSKLVMEACGTAHQWALTAVGAGHEVILSYPGYVKPYVRCDKTDSADAGALAQASPDPELKPLSAKLIDQQAMQSVHRIRQQMIDTRKQRINLARSLFAEFGVPLPTGTKNITTRLRVHEGKLLVLFTDSLGGISKRGDTYLRMLLIHDARAAFLGAHRKPANDKPVTRLQQRVTDLQQHHNITTVALSNRMVRII